MTQEEFEKEMLGENGFVRIRKEEGQDKHPTMLERYLEKRARQECEEKHGLEEKLKEITAERDYLRKKLQEERDFQEWLREHRSKGQCAGYVVMGISDVIEHGARDYAVKTQTALRKLVNNPALSDKVKNTLNHAMTLIELGQFWKRQVREWREKYEALKDKYEPRAKSYSEIMREIKNMPQVKVRDE